jgi:hypothetical protein
MFRVMVQELLNIKQFCDCKFNQIKTHFLGKLGALLIFLGSGQ